MTIETKYNIGDLLQSKFTFDNEPHPVIYEVQFIDVNTCIAGAQVFYKCRPYYIEYEKDYMYGGKKENGKVISIHHGTKDIPSGGIMFREDELVAAKQTLIDILKVKEVEGYEKYITIYLRIIVLVGERQILLPGSAEIPSQNNSRVLG